MVEKLKKLLSSALREISLSKDKAELEKIRVRYLGRKSGLLTILTSQIPTLRSNERSGLGTKINKARIEIETALKKFDGVERKENVDFDVTAPGKGIETGSLHPLTLIIEEVKEIFHYLGFVWVDGPELENDLYNFQKLDIPPEHPSRDVQQTYYLDDNLLLRTHTSSMQVRYMEGGKPPIRVLFPGRVSRREMPDATHSPSFHQIEGLFVDESTSMGELLGTLDFFAKSLFGPSSKIRVYGHHFPYTEPSIEVEVFHPKQGWLEILGAGMVRPVVLKNSRLDPAKYRGWAFGMGVERLAMIKYKIPDIRHFYTNDLRFLKQF